MHNINIEILIYQICEKMRPHKSQGRFRNSSTFQRVTIVRCSPVTYQRYNKIGHLDKICRQRQSEYVNIARWYAYCEQLH